MAIKYFIGCSGWWYKDWVGTFYPPNIPEEKRLKYYSQFFNTTEINVTFYKLPPKKLISSWVKRTPHYFVFSVKAPQELTHKLHFLFAPRIIKNFFDRIEQTYDEDYLIHLGKHILKVIPLFEEILRNHLKF